MLYTTKTDYASWKWRLWLKQRLQFLVSRESSAYCERGNDFRNECDDAYCARCGEDFAQLCNMEAITEEAEVSRRHHWMSRQRLESDAFTAHVPAWDAVVEQYHTGAALHWGALRTWRNMEEQIVHTVPFAYVQFYVRECGTCQKFRKSLNAYRIAPVVRHLKVPSARSTLGIDGFSITPPDKHGNAYMHAIVNMFTKHVYLFYRLLKRQTSNAIDAYREMKSKVDSIKLLGGLEREKRQSIFVVFLNTFHRSP